MKAIIGKKLGMTQVYDDAGQLQPVTVVSAGPCVVTRLREKTKDGYEAIQVAFGVSGSRNRRKVVVGQVKAAGLDYEPEAFRELPVEATETFTVGQKIGANRFAAGEVVDVSGTTKGRGFQGVVRRFRTAGGPASHGSMFHRRIGSIGMRQTPGRTWKNQAMPGHMGTVNRTVQNLQVVRVENDRDLILIRGSVPGPIGGLVTVKSAIKAR